MKHRHDQDNSKLRTAGALLRLLIALALAGCGGSSTLTPTKSATGTIVEFSVPTASSGPTAITAGPDGNLWFLESKTDKIAKITTNGQITEIPLGTTNAFPHQIVTSPDGDLWYVDNDNDLGTVSPDGAVTQTRVTDPSSLTVGPDNNIWVGEFNGGKIDVYSAPPIVLPFPATPQLLKSFPSNFFPTTSQLEWITTGPDGNLWYVSFGGDNIVKMTTGGATTRFNASPQIQNTMRQITRGPDGNLWVCAELDGTIGRVTTAGVITVFPLPTANSSPFGITSGPDGNLWFTERAGNKIGRITPVGTVTEFTIPTANAQPQGIVTGPDGLVWFTEFNGNKIGKIVP